jgi:hypothetical protein
MSDDDLVRLRNTTGADECNARGKSYKVSKWGTFLVPAADLEPLLKVGGFHRASPNDPSAINSTIEDCYEAAWHLPPSKARATLLAILESPNSLNHLVQSIAFS